MSSRHLSALLLLLLGPCFGMGQTVADMVHPLIGTAAKGQTFPATGVPFAMTDWTPQTRDGETKCVAPYYSADVALQGFRGSHFLSGSCTQDYGSLTLMPGTGPLRLSASSRAATFSRADEHASPYLYTVFLRRYALHAELTGTTRCGLLRFRTDRPGPAWVVVQTNARSRPTGTRAVSIDLRRNEISGENAVTRLYAGAGKPAGIRGFFVMQFDHPFRTSGLWNPSPTAPGSGAHVSFALRPGEALQVRIGTSFSSLDEARRNLAAEIPTWDFDRTVAAAHAAWDHALGAIEITGSAPERAVFYTALFHSMLLPRTVSDVDGSYPRFAGGASIEHTGGRIQYDDFSLWDTFRALHPLLTILDPAREGDMVASLLAKGAQGGFLPIFPAWNSYTSEMIGDHADAVIVDAWSKGIHGFDPELAYRLMRHNALDSPSPAEYRDGRGRRALASYLKYGYVPVEDHVPFAFHKDEQASRTLEYAYDDFLIGRMAAGLGKTDDDALFAAHARNWQNAIDPATGFARGRHADGSWVQPFHPAKPASFITEGLPFQYTFFVPQDLPGLIDRLHGPAAFEARLDELFARGLYDQGNEPSHHIAFLYNLTASPWKTQRHIRDLLDTQYHDLPGGLSGNDDAGQMSAWYVMAALGLYQVTPGVPEYELTTPRFDDVTLHLPEGRTLHILAPGAEAGSRFVAGVSLNGTPLSGHALSHQALMTGGELRFTVCPKPSRAWPTHTQ